MDVFRDEVKIADWMPSDEVKFRQKSIDYLHQAGEFGLLPTQTVSDVKIFGAGETSIVFLVNAESPFVVKMTSHPGVVENEAAFYSAWSEEGVKTPQVLSVHSSEPQLPASFMVMEYVEAPILSDTVSEDNFVAIAREMGTTLARMHRAKGAGFGYIQTPGTLRGRYETFTDEAEQGIFKERGNWLIEQGVISEGDLAIARRAVAVLEGEIAAGTKPSLTHNDFRPYNMFATRPITVFDPNPAVLPPVMDLAQTLIKSWIEETERGKQEAEEILMAYRQVLAVDDRSLSAAVLIRSIKTLNTWQRKGKDEKAQKLLRVMKEHQERI